VSELRGHNSQLLHETELTPEMSDDLVKFVIPILSQATRTSGRISLILDDFTWPLGKGDATELKGRLTLHSVECGPGELTKSIAELLSPEIAAATVEIAKDDVVTFSMHGGRVYHENLAFSLAGIQATSHGSVGLDETLDWFVDFEFPALEALDVSQHPILKVLGDQHPTLHFTGTLGNARWKLEGASLSALRTLFDFIHGRIEKRDETPRPKLLPGRRGGNSPTDAAR